MGAISNILANELFVQLCWNSTDYSARQTSQIFNLGTLGQCFLELKNRHYSGTQYYFSISINFTENPAFDQTNLQLSVVFGHCNSGFTFNLTKNGTVFTSEEKLVNLLTNSYSSWNTFITISLPEHNSKKKISDNDSLAESMKQLLADKTYSDLKLIVDDQVFYVHKNILSRNKIFSKMIESDMLEKKTGEIQLPGWNPMVVQEMLRYIYTFKCDVKLNTHELFKLAHFLEIKPLQSLCKNYLLKYITVKNVTQTLELTKHSLYELSELLEAAKKFVASNESQLAKDLDYVEYLNNNINIHNITSILRFANTHQVECLLQTVMEFIINNHSEVMDIEDCKNLVMNNGPLAYKLWISTLERMKSLSLQDKESEE